MKTAAKISSKPMRVALGGLLLLTGAAVVWSCLRSPSSASVLTVDEISAFPMDPVAGTVEAVPERFRKLDGQRVTLVGYQWNPNVNSPTLSDFELVGTLRRRHGPPAVQGFVACHSAAPVPFYDGIVRATGILRVRVTAAQGKVSGVYWLEVEQVEPGPGEGERP